MKEGLDQRTAQAVVDWVKKNDVQMFPKHGVITENGLEFMLQMNHNFAMRVIRNILERKDEWEIRRCEINEKQTKPLFTKKHYEAFAKFASGTSHIYDYDLAEFFKKDNPNFDVEGFVQELNNLNQLRHPYTNEIWKEWKEEWKEKAKEGKSDA
tara:strand:- start:717 stop:1178 length:462 start_codon:yes stop_codon:yes gene_type:complete